MPGNMAKEDDMKRSNVIKMPNRKPKSNPTAKELERGGWKDLMRPAISSHWMRRHSDLRKICKTLG
jgi:hypothetical protein